jgi:hypothetical protein
MNKVTKAAVASLLTLGLAGGATAAFAGTGSGSSPDPVKDGKVDVAREHKAVEKSHDTTKDRVADKSGKDNYKESWDHKDGSKDGRDGSGDPSPDLSLR